MQPSDRVRTLTDNLSDIEVNLAMRGLLGRHLPPKQWEALRQKLQRIYRTATGELDAILTVKGGDNAE